MSARRLGTFLGSGRAVTLWVEEDASGQPVGLEVRAGKVGDQFSAWLSCLADTVSHGLQRGVPVSAYVHGLRRQAGDEGSEAVDWIARTLGEAYGHES